MIRKRKIVSKQTINLDGSDGNAFVLFGYARKFSGQLNLDTDKILFEMKKGDYKHLVWTFNKYFGDYIILETEQEELLQLEKMSPELKRINEIKNEIGY